MADPSLLRSATRVGLLTNDAARPARDVETPSRLALLRAGVPLVRLFSPEHGIAAAAADGAVTRDTTDPVTGLPVTSLYGDHFAPPASVLRDLDAVLVDLPDIGARFYTYQWTMTHVIDACAGGPTVVVLDRPNPLGGALDSAEGPLLDPAFTSLLGRLDVPVRHALTLGELARLWRHERAAGTTVEVVACEGWSRAMQWPDTGLPFVRRSPDMPSFASALLYPGTCLFEATTVSVGRGTEAPFRTLDAPWLDAARLADALHDEPRTAGIALVPDGHRLSIAITDRHRVRPVALGVALLAAVAAHHRDAFAWATYPTAANPTGAHHLERLFGQAGLRDAIDRGTRIGDDVLATGTWAARVTPHLAYT